MRREYGDYIEDIVDAMNKAMKFVEGMDFDEFILDEKTVFAVVRALEIAGEAVKKIPEEMKIKYPEIPWRDLAGIRDRLIHEYFSVNLEIVWNSVKEEIPVIKPLFEEMLEELKDAIKKES